MEKYTKGKALKSTKPSIAALKESPSLVCTPSNPELKCNPLVTRKPLTTPSFDPINMAKFKYMGKQSTLTTVAVTKRTAANTRSDVEVQKVQKNNSKSPIIVKTQKYFNTVLKNSSSSPNTNSRNVLRVTASKSNERTTKINCNNHSHSHTYDSNTNLKAIRPKSVQSIQSGWSSSLSLSSSSSVRKKVPGPSFDTLTILQEKKDVSPKRIAQHRFKLKLGEQTKQSSNLTAPSPYKTTTKLPAINNSQSGSGSRPRSRQKVKENSDIKDTKFKAVTTPGPKLLPLPISKLKPERVEPKVEKKTKTAITGKSSNFKPTEKVSTQNQQNQSQASPTIRIKLKTDGNSTASSNDNPKSEVADSPTPTGTPSSVTLKPSENCGNSSGTEKQKAKSPKSNRQHDPATNIGLKTPKSSRISISRPHSAGKISHAIKVNVSTNVDDNFSALLLQTLKLVTLEGKGQGNIGGAGDAIPTNQELINVSMSTETEGGICYSQCQMTRENMKMDNVDNLPFVFALKSSPENKKKEMEKTETINPPVNTPVSPKSPTSDCSDYKDNRRKGGLSKSYYSEDDEPPSQWGKKTESKEELFGHDFIAEYLQLESVREVNHVAQVMFRAKLCREFKGADPNLSLEQLKLTRSHYLQLPCFADPKFFAKIKVSPAAFMNKKKPDNDLLTIEYLQNKMENLSRKNFKTMEAHTHLRRSKANIQPQHPNSTDSAAESLITPEIQSQSQFVVHPGSGRAKDTSSAGVLGNLTKEFYIQSLQKIFQSLDLPNWGKDCFGSMSDEEIEDENEDEGDEDCHDDNGMEDMCGDGDKNKLILLSNESFLYSPTSMMDVPSCHDGTTLAKRILNIYENRKMKEVQKINIDIDKSIGLKDQEDKSINNNNSKSHEFEDDASSDNQPESQ